jgi:zinc/manganese transport system substrate-binding protein
MKYYIFSFVLLFGLNSEVQAELSVFACEPEWAALSNELGGDDISTYSATSGLQDPHYIQARPSLIAKARRADLMVCTGAELETGWLPLLQRKSGNKAIQTGADGLFFATDFVSLKGKPTTLDRSMGHIHSAGNPHIQTNPYLILTVAKQLNLRFQKLDPDHAQQYQLRWLDFKQRWEAAITQWEVKAITLQGMNLVVQHDNWAYLFEWLKLNKVATLEAKPGVPPSISDLNQVLEQLKSTPAKAVIHAAYQSSRASDWLKNKTDITKVTLPFTVGGTPQSSTLFELFDDTIDQLLTVNSK